MADVHRLPNRRPREGWVWLPTKNETLAHDANGILAQSASLRDPRGVVVAAQESIGQTHQFVASPRDVAISEVCGIQLAKPPKGVLEDFTVQFQGVPRVLAAFREDLLNPASR